MFEDLKNLYPCEIIEHIDKVTLNISFFQKNRLLKTLDSYGYELISSKPLRRQGSLVNSNSAVYKKTNQEIVISYKDSRDKHYLMLAINDPTWFTQITIIKMLDENLISWNLSSFEFSWDIVPKHLNDVWNIYHLLNNHVFLTNKRGCSSSNCKQTFYSDICIYTKSKGYRLYLIPKNQKSHTGVRFELLFNRKIIKRFDLCYPITVPKIKDKVNFHKMIRFCELDTNKLSRYLHKKMKHDPQIFSHSKSPYFSMFHCSFVIDKRNRKVVDILWNEENLITPSFQNITDSIKFNQKWNRSFLRPYLKSLNISQFLNFYSSLSSLL